MYIVMERGISRTDQRTQAVIDHAATLGLQTNVSFMNGGILIQLSSDGMTKPSDHLSEQFATLSRVTDIIPAINLGW